jgi:hypothetical protein
MRPDRPEAFHRADTVSRKVSAGQNRLDTGRLQRIRNIDMADDSVSVGRTDEGAMQGANDIDVGNVTAFAAQQPFVFEAQDGGADAVRSPCRVLVHGRPLIHDAGSNRLVTRGLFNLFT